MWKHDEVVGYIGTAIGAASTIAQTEEILHLIQAVATIITLAITTTYTIWKWYKKAKKDGKITEDEIDELFDSLKKNKEDE